MPPRTILVYFVTWPAVGHAVEALRHSFCYSAANPGSEIHLVLDNRTSIELAEACPWIAATHVVDVSSRSPQDPGTFRDIPKEWDYVTSDRRRYSSPSGHDLARTYDDYRSYARPTSGPGSRSAAAGGRRCRTTARRTCESRCPKQALPSPAAWCLRETCTSL
jgi:hypothetical protein